MIALSVPLQVSRKKLLLWINFIIWTLKKTEALNTGGILWIVLTQKILKFEEISVYLVLLDTALFYFNL
jgi:hypothetical protein